MVRHRKRRRAPPRKVHDMRHLYDAMPSGLTVATTIDEPGGLYSSDSATLEPARHADGTISEGAPEWVPPARPTIIVAQSIHKDPLGQMHARDQIDRPRFLAGRNYQELHSVAAIGNIGAIDPAKPYVQGGRVPEMITDRQQQASKLIRRLDSTLFKSHGREGLWLTRMILIEKLTMTRAADQRGGSGRANIRFLGFLFRVCLTELAVGMGYATATVRREDNAIGRARP